MSAPGRLTIAFAAALVLAAGCARRHADPAELFNQKAALPAGLPDNPLGWKVVTSGVNRANGTMFTLYGNDAAVAWARSPVGSGYPAGSVLGLVTWQRQDDVHWFGARIPGQVRSVEFVRVTGDAQSSYEDWEGSPAHRVIDGDPIVEKARAAFILAQRASVLP